MTKYLTPIAFAFVLSSGIANANIVKSSNQAVTACKAHLKTSISGYKKAKLSKVRSSRAHHSATFSVSSEAGRERLVCHVNKQDGLIELIR